MVACIDKTTRFIHGIQEHMSKVTVKGRIVDTATLQRELDARFGGDQREEWVSVFHELCLPTWRIKETWFKGVRM